MLKGHQVSATVQDQPERLAEVLEFDGAQPAWVSGCDRDRACIVFIGPAGRLTGQFAGAVRERSGHVHDLFADHHQLLAEQLAQTDGVLDRPDPLRSSVRPDQQPIDLPPISGHPQLRCDLFVVVEHYRSA